MDDHATVSTRTHSSTLERSPERGDVVEAGACGYRVSHVLDREVARMSACTIATTATTAPSSSASSVGPADGDQVQATLAQRHRQRGHASQRGSHAQDDAPCPRAAFTACRPPSRRPAGPALLGLTHPLAVVVLGLVGGVVLDHDAVAVEDVARLVPVILEDDTPAGTAPVAADVAHVDRRAVERTAKLTTPSVSVGSPVTVPWSRKRLVPRLLALRHRLVGVAEVEGGVREPLEHQDAERHQDDAKHDERHPAATPAAGSGTGPGATGTTAAVGSGVVERAGRQLHRRSSGGTCRDSAGRGPAAAPTRGIGTDEGRRAAPPGGDVAGVRHGHHAGVLSRSPA